MTKIDASLIKKLRDATGAGVMRVKQVLEEVKEDEGKALEILKKEGFEKAAKREGRETGQGLVRAYIHHSNKVGSIVEVLCETDFVACTEVFEELAKNVAMQVASMDPKDVDELLDQEFIKDPTKKIGDLVKEASAKTGENIKVGSIHRVQLGK